MPRIKPGVNAPKSVNLRKLASVLRSVPTSHHDQGGWVGSEPKNECGTTGCALGWAAMSGQFEGLDWAIPLVQKDFGPPLSWATTSEEAKLALLRGHNAVPVLNGERTGWDGMGIRLFGSLAYHEVFMNLNASKSATIKGLLKAAKVEEFAEKGGA